MNACHPGLDPALGMDQPKKLFTGEASPTWDPPVAYIAGGQPGEKEGLETQEDSSGDRDTLGGW